jgi:hypothetical protein
MAQKDTITRQAQQLQTQVGIGRTQSPCCALRGSSGPRACALRCVRCHKVANPSLLQHCIAAFCAHCAAYKLLALLCFTPFQVGICQSAVRPV